MGRPNNTRHVNHDLFRFEVSKDREGARQLLMGALRDNHGVTHRAAEALGLKEWFFREQCRTLEVERDTPEARLWPTRLQIALALIHYRGDHTLVADHFQVPRNWLVKAMADYGLRKWLPEARSPFWSIYAD